jgi:amino acid adenylation domain-containing protein
VPLDASYPLERLSFMMEDAQLPLLVTLDSLATRLPKHRAGLVRLDADWTEIATRSVENPEVGVSVEGLAYVIYTSGSTGTPKAALLHHRGAANLSAAQLRLLSPDSSSRVLQFSSLSFDASVFDLLMALLSGAELHLATPDELLPGPGLRDLLERRRITHLTLPPSALAALPHAELPDLRVLVVAGEALPEELVARWARPGRRLFNAYGPTEATVWVSAAECRVGGGKPLIGRPIANARAYVLDAGLRAQPEGAAGELYVGGAGVGRGYLNRPGLTAERFVPDPFSGEAGARLYRTGDVARWRGGELEYLGRVDGQVKVRGYRVELGEVEAVLASHPGVREAAAAVKGAGAEARLVGYYVREEGAEVSGAEVRQYLRGLVPEYLVPGVVVELERMPVSGSGKLDRKALPEGVGGREGAGEAFAPPRNAVELTIASVWQKALQIDSVGIDDNFFDLGGHSLLIIRVHSELRDGLKPDLSVIDLLKYPTVRSLAAYLTAGGSEPAPEDDGGRAAEKLNEGKNRLKRMLRQKQRVQEERG